MINIRIFVHFLKVKHEKETNRIDSLSSNHVTNSINSLVQAFDILVSILHEPKKNKQ